MVPDAPGWGTDLNEEAVIARTWEDTPPLCLKAVVGTTRVGHPLTLSPAPLYPSSCSEGLSSVGRVPQSHCGSRREIGIPVPSHNKGQIPIHIHMHDRHLFTGDILRWSHRQSEFDVTPVWTWYS